MPMWKRTLLTLYYQSTRPYRDARLRTACDLGQAPIGVVVFHRIADDQANAWTTPTSTFRRAIDWLERRFDLISLAEVQHRLRAGRSDRPAVAITFDDGYAVNCEHALPLLIRRQIPCTYFVTTAPVLAGVPFEHDARMGNHHLAPNTVEQLKSLVQSGIEIGAHSRTHADFGTIDDLDVLFDELVVARDDLQRAVGQTIRYFAFPFGIHHNLSQAAFAMAREHGYAGVCSAYGGYNQPGDDPFHLQRRGVDGALVRLKNWTTVDPLRHRRIVRFAETRTSAAPVLAGTHS